MTLWLSLDPWGVGVEDGALLFATGSHKAKALPSLRKLPRQQRVAAVSLLSDADISQHWTIAGGDGALPAASFAFHAAEGGGEGGARRMQAGDASAHLGWTYHRAQPNTGSHARCALAVTFFADGAKFYSDVLHMGSTSESVRGIEFQLEDGTRIVAQLLSDDVGTWVPWLLNREMMPGAAARPSSAILLRPPAPSARKEL